MKPPAEVWVIVGGDEDDTPCCSPVESDAEEMRARLTKHDPEYGPYIVYRYVLASEPKGSDVEQL